MISDWIKSSKKTDSEDEKQEDFILIFPLNISKNATSGSSMHLKSNGKG